MKDQDKTKEQLINELAEMRRRIAESEAADTERKQADDLMRAQRDLSLALSTAPGLDETLSLCLEAAIRVSGMDCGGVYLIDEASGSVDLVLHQGLPPDFVRSASRYDADSASAHLVMAGKPIYARHRELGVSLNEARRHEALRAIAVVPVCHEGRVVACLNIASHTLDEVPDFARTALETMASQIGSAVVRAKMEEALRESEERFRELAELLPQTICETDERGNLTFVNRRAFEDFGYDREDFEKGLNVLKILISEDRDRATENIGRVLGGEDLGGVEYTVQRKDGTTFPVVIYTNVIIRRGKLVGLRGIMIDTTERKRMEDALRRRAQELATLQATVLDITAPHDLPTLLQTIVERATLLLNAPGGGLYLCDPDREEARCVVSYNTPSDYTGTVLKYGEGAAGIVAQTGKPLSIDDYRTWSGRADVYEEEQPFTAVLSAPMIWQGQVAGVIHVLHNVEGQRFTQADLELLTLFANHAAIAVENARLYEKARQDAETKATLLQEVNHRVKNNLTAIIGLLHIEQSYARVADQAAYEVITQNLTNRVSALATVHSLLSASEWAPLSLSDLAGQVIKSALQMRPRDKQVFIDAPPSPVHVTPDQAHKLALVINELATNTIQHTLPGRSTAHVSVRIALEDDGLASHTVLLEYRDDGPGYPEDVLQLDRHAVGFDLIQNLTRRSLRGELSLHNDEGAVAVIRFPAQA